MIEHDYIFSSFANDNATVKSGNYFTANLENWKRIPRNATNVVITTEEITLYNDMFRLIDGYNNHISIGLENPLQTRVITIPAGYYTLAELQEAWNDAINTAFGYVFVFGNHIELEYVSNTHIIKFTHGAGDTTPMILNFDLYTKFADLIGAMHDRMTFGVGKICYSCKPPKFSSFDDSIYVFTDLIYNGVGNNQKFVRNIGKIEYSSGEIFIHKEFQNPWVIDARNLIGVNRDSVRVWLGFKNEDALMFTIDYTVRIKIKYDLLEEINEKNIISTNNKVIENIENEQKRTKTRIRKKKVQ